jgi:hypothetical protein
MARGTLQQIHRFPVKSMAGESPQSVLVTEKGIAGDRAHAVWQRRGRRLSARVAPKLLRWNAAYEGVDSELDPADPPRPVVHAPSGRTYAFDRRDEELRAAINEDLGRTVALVRDPDGLQDVQSTLLITVEASRARLEEELGAPVDVRRFRTNLHVDLDAEPFAESDWQEGALLRVGGLELELAHPCDRCAIVIHDPEQHDDPWPRLLKHINAEHGTFFGFRATPRNQARIAVGDAVEVDAP